MLEDQFQARMCRLFVDNSRTKNQLWIVKTFVVKISLMVSADGGWNPCAWHDSRRTSQVTSSHLSFAQRDRMMGPPPQASAPSQPRVPFIGATSPVISNMSAGEKQAFLKDGSTEKTCQNYTKLLYPTMIYLYQSMNSCWRLDQ